MAGIKEGSIVIARFTVPLSVTSERPEFSSDTISLKRKSASQGGFQRWVIEAGLEPTVSSADFLVSSVIAGDSGVVDVEMPQVYRKSGATTATAALSSSAAATGATSVTASNNTSLRVAKGEFIQFVGHSKVYLVTSLLNGNGTLNFTPGLVAAVSAGALIKTGNAVTLQGYYDSSTIKGMQYSDGILLDPGTIRIIEKL